VRGIGRSPVIARCSKAAQLLFVAAGETPVAAALVLAAKFLTTR